ncbi:muconate cycloisomerase [Longispora fulva]|uniref:L-alanine-DL-glutamate epimerase-like enolase superfamily enzyme n=1 Tax=Longispora fulva TaxID=619741 RepID=A0A8J7KFM9_9ACTN|nr:enolase C-terminal domain-like protein [Longispora fulva]MBG6136395.1 L-alanine-DL-glutamate epimerase-like enolase superfamily enzyme [Longispora fulva]GIG59563.1 muconate cycloisomerase [Longispora fulva]
MRLTWSVTTLRLREPFHTSRGVTGEREAVEVAVEHDGVIGHGEVVTSRYYQLDVAAIATVLARLSPVVAACRSEAELRATLPGLRLTHPDTLAVIAAVDAAAHDLIGRANGLAAHRVLGTPPVAGPRTAYTIGLRGPRDAAIEAARLVGRGFGVLKLKLGRDDDVAVVAAVRSAAPDVTLLLDPNGGWDADTASRRLDALAGYGIAAVEQPVRHGHLALLTRVAARSPIPVIADEDARTADDVGRLAGLVHGVNVKLVECGGLGGAVEMARTAKALGMQVMLGCLASSTLSVAPAVHLAGLARWLDLDGHLLLAEDPWTGIGGTDGTLTQPTSPGLGVRRR